MGDKELGDKDKAARVATGEGAPRAGGPEEADAGERGCIKARAGTRVPAAGCWCRHPGVPRRAASRDPMGGVGCPSTLCCPRNCPGTTEAPPWAPGGSPGTAAAFLLGIRTSRGRSRCLQAPRWGLSVLQAVPLPINQLLISRAPRRGHVPSVPPTPGVGVSSSRRDAWQLPACSSSSWACAPCAKHEPSSRPWHRDRRPHAPGCREQFPSLQRSLAESSRQPEPRQQV